MSASAKAPAAPYSRRLARSTEPESRWAAANVTKALEPHRVAIDACISQLDSAPAGPLSPQNLYTSRLPVELASPVLCATASCDVGWAHVQLRCARRTKKQPPWRGETRRCHEKQSIASLARMPFVICAAAGWPAADGRRLLSRYKRQAPQQKRQINISLTGRGESEAAGPDALADAAETGVTVKKRCRTDGPRPLATLCHCPHPTQVKLSLPGPFRELCRCLASCMCDIAGTEASVPYFRIAF
jgi:hypothetical protein